MRQEHGELVRRMNREPTNGEIRHVFFDLGNVLLPFDFGRAAKQLSARTGRPEMEVTWTMATVVEKTRYELGRCSTQEFIESVSRAFGIQPSFQEFKRLWGDIFTENHEMVQLARSLRGVMSRHILSNTNELHIEFIRETFPFFHEFDGYVYSYLEGVAKPDARFYRIALERAGADAAHSLFIDDRQENVIGARQVGMKAVHYADQTQAMKEIKQCLRLE